MLQRRLLKLSPRLSFKKFIYTNCNVICQVEIAQNHLYTLNIKYSEKFLFFLVWWRFLKYANKVVKNNFTDGLHWVSD